MTAGGRRRGALTLLDRWLAEATVEHVERITSRMRHVRVRGADLVGLDWTPGQSTRVVFSDPTHVGVWLSWRQLRDAARSYSIWNADPEAGSVELIVLDHGGDGPGSAWARTVRPGDPVLLLAAAEGTFVARLPSPYHLFAGEETAAVCFGAILRALPPGERVRGVLEAESAEGHFDLPRDADLVRVHRDGASPSPSRTLVEALRGLDLPDHPGTAYLAGEARTIQAARRHLVHDRGWPRTAIRTKPFWAPGKRGLD
jgi:NADPH-dependent ferric siderophore reductase